MLIHQILIRNVTVYIKKPVQIWYALKINVFSIVLEVSAWHVGYDCKSAALGIAR
jgi:hypothetical protein